MGNTIDNFHHPLDPGELSDPDEDARQLAAWRRNRGRMMMASHAPPTPGTTVPRRSTTMDADRLAAICSSMRREAVLRALSHPDARDALTEVPLHPPRALVHLLRRFPEDVPEDAPFDALDGTDLGRAVELLLERRSWTPFELTEAIDEALRRGDPSVDNILALLRAGGRIPRRALGYRMPAAVRDLVEGVLQSNAQVIATPTAPPRGPFWDAIRGKQWAAVPEPPSGAAAREALDLISRTIVYVHEPQQEAFAAAVRRLEAAAGAPIGQSYVAHLLDGDVEPRQAPAIDSRDTAAGDDPDELLDQLARLTQAPVDEREFVRQLQTLRSRGARVRVVPRQPVVQDLFDSVFNPPDEADAEADGEMVALLRPLQHVAWSFVSGPQITAVSAAPDPADPQAALAAAAVAGTAGAAVIPRLVALGAVVTADVLRAALSSRGESNHPAVCALIEAFRGSDQDDELLELAGRRKYRTACDVLVRRAAAVSGRAFSALPTEALLQLAVPKVRRGEPLDLDAILRVSTDVARRLVAERGIEPSPAYIAWHAGEPRGRLLGPAAAHGAALEFANALAIKRLMLGGNAPGLDAGQVVRIAHSAEPRRLRAIAHFQPGGLVAATLRPTGVGALTLLQCAAATRVVGFERLREFREQVAQTVWGRQWERLPGRARRVVLELLSGGAA